MIESGYISLKNYTYGQKNQRKRRKKKKNYKRSC